MPGKKYCLIILAVLIIISSNFIACNKEQISSDKSDTTVIATVIQPDSITGKNAIVESIVPDMNFGNYPIISAFAWTDTEYFNIGRSFIYFDLSKIQAYTAINSAKLSIYFDSYANLNAQTGENAFTIYRVSQSWNVNTVTWNNQPSYSNLDSVVVAKSTFENQSYLNIDVTNMVRDMITNPTVSFGFCIKLNEESPYALVVLGSCYCKNVSVHPKLIIYY